jgi:hypothetical protein
MITSTIFIQYCVVKPLMALIAIILGIYVILSNFPRHCPLTFDHSDRYTHHHSLEFDLFNVHFYGFLITNASVAYAFYVLANFYHALKNKLKRYHPLGKFLCIKFVIFFAFWQVSLLTISLCGS